MVKSDIFPYGSRVYGTVTESSDYDLIVVADDKCDIINQSVKTDVKYWTVAEFQELLNNHEISALECYFQQAPHKLNHEYHFELDLTKLRSACSAKASNSWVKAKKKLMPDSSSYAPYIGKKSAWHAIRILDFACQIARYGKITDYHSCNYLYGSVMSTKNWEELQMLLKPIYNEQHSLLRKLAPKIK